jgi:hypothetical protein
MPPINRDKNTEYVILIITDGTKKILDITTEKNRRNYKFKILNELKAKTDKRNLVCQEFKNSNVDAIEIEVLDNINGTYLDALKYMDKIATKYNYKTTKAINTTILDMQIELKATKTNEEPVMENEEDTFTHKTPPTQTTEEHEEEPAPVAEVKKPKKAVQKIKLKPLEDDKVTEDITEAINTPITKPIEPKTEKIVIEATKATEDLEYKVILPSLNKPKATKQKTNTKPPIAIVIDVDEEEEVTPTEPKINKPTTSGIVKLTKKQEQQKNKLIQDNAQTITDYYTLKKEKDCLEAKMNTLHLAILTNYTTLANSFQYADGSINDFNFE